MNSTGRTGSQAAEAARLLVPKIAVAVNATLIAKLFIGSPSLSLPVPFFDGIASLDTVDNLQLLWRLVARPYGVAARAEF
jgi:hypothetical protein